MKLPDFKIERFFSRLEFAAPLMMCASDCESMSIGELLELEDGAAERFHQQRLGYTETAGAPSLRAEIAKQYSTVTADGVLVHAGGEEVIFTFMNAVLDPGDHVIAHSPCYQSLQEIARGIGCEVTPWQTRPRVWSKWRADWPPNGKTTWRGIANPRSRFPSPTIHSICACAFRALSLS